MSKYAKKVYACPLCWRFISIGKRPESLYYCCGVDHEPINLIIFDSQIEHKEGIGLKTMENAGLMQDLKHHKKFELAPRIYYDYGTAHFGKWFPPNEKTSIEIPHPYRHYESDFSFTQDGIERVIEVKHITKKKKTGYYRDPITKEKVKATQSISWPFFTPRDPLSHFRVKCQLMKAIKHIDVEIWAGDKRFKFDGKWKLVEVLS